MVDDFVEVKRRKTREDATWTLPAKQRRRIVPAAQYWLASRHDTAFDVVLTAPWRLPQHIVNAFPV